MRRFPLQFSHSADGSPVYFVLGGQAALADFTAIFHGKGWVDSSDVVTPHHQPQPSGTRLLAATTFEIVGNPDGLNGRYTVYTPGFVGDYPSSEFNAGTKVYVNEVLLLGDHTYVGNGDGGYVENISTYLLTIFGEPDTLVYEGSHKEGRPIELVGRLASGWGEVLLQNSVNISQCFASPAAPTDPFQGQLWFNTLDSVLMVYHLGSWSVVNESFFGKPPVKVAFTTTGTPGSYTATITHNLGLDTPYIATTSFFVDIGGGVYKPIIPSDITFVNADSLIVTFSNPYSGYVVVRQ